MVRAISTRATEQRSCTTLQGVSETARTLTTLPRSAETM